MKNCKTEILITKKINPKTLKTVAEAVENNQLSHNHQIIEINDLGYGIIDLVVQCRNRKSNSKTYYGVTLDHGVNASGAGNSNGRFTADEKWNLHRKLNRLTYVYEGTRHQRMIAAYGPGHEYRPVKSNHVSRDPGFSAPNSDLIESLIYKYIY